MPPLRSLLPYLNSTPHLLLLALLCLCVTLVALNAGPASATVTLSSTGKQLRSRPASFGFELEYGIQYVALLQAAKGDPHLCAGINDVEDGEAGDVGGAGGLFEEGDDDGGRIQEGRRGLRATGGPFLTNHMNTIGDLPGGWARGGIDVFSSSEGIKIGGMAELPEQDHEKVALGKSKVDIGDLDMDAQADKDGDGDEDEDRENETDEQEKQPKEIHVTPSHGVPVAILAKRGQCTYETKARVASTLTSPRGAVRFVIVYDDQPRDGNHLITMMPKHDGGDERDARRRHELWKEVGLVFVSYESGVDLLEFLSTESFSVKSQGGPRILIDGSDRWVFPPMDQSAAGLTFLLMMFGCVCSLSLCLNTAFYSGRGSGDSVANDNQLFLLGPDGQVINGEETGGQASARNGSSGRRRDLRLLTLEEVETLPTREYSPPGPSLELRDKSNMPFLADDDQRPSDISLHDRAAARDNGGVEEEDEPPRGEGGFCESLLPSCPPHKDPDGYGPYFNQNSCSICLDDYLSGEQIRVLPCQHTFHSSCIFPWLTERSPTCPLCKAMFEAVHYEEGEDEEAPGEDERARGEDAEGGQAGGEDAAAQDGGEDGGRQRQRREEDRPAGAEAGEPLPAHGERRRERRRQERRARAERREDGAARRAGRDSNTVERDVAAAMEGNEEEETIISAEPQPPSRVLRGRFWGLFGAPAPEAAAGALDEPLLATSSESDGNDDDAI